MEHEPSSKKTVILEVADVVFKSWWTLVAGLCVGLLGAQVLLHVLPKTFSASTMVRIAPPAIPERMLNTTVTEDIGERLFAVKESILSREYLERVLAAHFEVSSSPAVLEAELNDLRERIEIVTDPRAAMFSLAYHDADPQQAADVINTLTRLYVEENAEFRAQRATETASTFERMAAEALHEKEVAELALNDFLVDHPGQTERDLDLNLRQKQMAQDDLESKRNDRRLAQTRLEVLEERLRTAEQSLLSTAPSTGVLPAVDPDRRRLAELEAELGGLRARYLESHPAVQEVERQIATLRAQLAGNPGAEPGTAPPDPRLAPIQTEIDQLERQIAGLQQDEASLGRKIAEFDHKISVTPEIQRKYSELHTALTVARTKYDDLQKKAEGSRSAVFLESEQKGARLEVVEWAVVPFIPVSPVPLQVFGLSLLGGLLIFVGPLVARTLLNPIVRSEAGLRAVAAGVPVLIEIPRIATREMAGAAQRRRLKNVVLSVLSVAALVTAFVVTRKLGG